MLLLIYLTRRLGALEVEESPFGRVGIELAQYWEPSIASAEESFAGEFELMPTSAVMRS